MKKFLFSAFLLTMATSSFGAKWTYSNAHDVLVSNEKEMVMCAPAPDDAGLCYEETISKYNNLIREVRSQNASKVDSKLWQTINLNYKNAIDTCRSDKNLAGSRLFFYPYQDCMTNHLHNLAVTTIELHLR